MQYMLLIFADEAKWAAKTADEMASAEEAYVRFTQGIVKSGHFRAAGRLQPSSTATTVREKSGKRLTTDGPYAEAKEQIAGYYLVECENLDEAMAIAGRVPGVGFGDAIEIRPLNRGPESMSKRAT